MAIINTIKISKDEYNRNPNPDPKHQNLTPNLKAKKPFSFVMLLEGVLPSSSASNATLFWLIITFTLQRKHFCPEASVVFQDWMV